MVSPADHHFLELQVARHCQQDQHYEYDNQHIHEKPLLDFSL